ncbi:hypothetical protein PGTUg99_018133 [Puccinia graminis f. sp. tritici]|uniref:Uncharacterized protein n=1 Tax=Puccinia graminis f. sp. tritici TaxID=56615 RepID=A0A5B0PW45_PUCGR|nr:hypothetical protein PGTUg99_018133 [Puccinia graminis f. sp. tritici]
MLDWRAIYSDMNLCAAAYRRPSFVSPMPVLLCYAPGALRNLELRWNSFTTHTVLGHGHRAYEDSAENLILRDGESVNSADFQDPPIATKHLTI